MEHLSNAQLRRALHATQELAELDDLAQLPECTASMLRRLIPCDIASYNAVDPISQQASVAADPAESVFDGGVEALAQFAHQNPLVAFYARTGDGRALRISDFMSRRQLHRTDLYNLVYRPIALEHQLAIAMPSPQRSLGRPAELIGLTLSRSRRDFNAAEQLLLEYVRPHFAGTLARLHEPRAAAGDQRRRVRVLALAPPRRPRRGDRLAERRGGAGIGRERGRAAASTRARLGGCRARPPCSRGVIRGARSRARQRWPASAGAARCQTPIHGSTLCT